MLRRAPVASLPTYLGKRCVVPPHASQGTDRPRRSTLRPVSDDGNAAAAGTDHHRKLHNDDDALAGHGSRRRRRSLLPRSRALAAADKASIEITPSYDPKPRDNILFRTPSGRDQRDERRQGRVLRFGLIGPDARSSPVCQVSTRLQLSEIHEAQQFRKLGQAPVLVYIAAISI